MGGMAGRRASIRPPPCRRAWAADACLKDPLALGQDASRAEIYLDCLWVPLVRCPAVGRIWAPLSLERP